MSPASTSTPTGESTGRPMRRLSQLSPANWGRVVVQGLLRLWRSNGIDLAAALTFWSLLGLFPAAIVVVALVGLVATSDAAIETIVDTLDELVPAEAAAMLESRLTEVVAHRTAAGVLLSFGVLGALWTASAYLRSFTRAANSIYGVTEQRPAYRLLPLQLGLTVVALLLAAVVVVGLLVSGPVARALGEAMELEAATVRVWEIAKWPVLILIAGLLLSLLFWVAPSVEQPRFRWLTVGGAVALAVWIVVSVGFAFYVASFGAYDVTYGTLGAAIVFLMWVFLTNGAILLGVGINAELHRLHRRAATGEIPAAASA